MSKLCITLVPHTHWDREWYATFQQFRFKLVKVMDRLLGILASDPRYRCFVLDGQTAPVGDYLEIRPEREGEIAQMVREGRLLIGPWYTLPDEYLVSAEAIVRNLLMGHRDAARFGGAMKVGLVPDPFGHISQLPQILRGFGIDSFIFTRGLGDEGETLDTEFIWEGADGSCVLAVHQVDGYCNAYDLGYKYSSRWRDDNELDLEDAVARVRKQIEKHRPKASTQNILLNNGCDQLPPQPELADIVEYINSRLDDAEVTIGSYADYLDRVRAAHPKLQVRRGEMHGSRYQCILAGVYSTRMYLKQANFRAEVLMEKYAEPLSALAMHLGWMDVRGLLRQAWRLILGCQAHDSIGGCAIDQVHRENEIRLSEAEQIAEAVAGAAADAILRMVRGSQEASIPILVFNPHNWPVKDVVRIHIKLPLQEDEKPRGIRILDASGKIVASQLSNQTISDVLDPIIYSEAAYDADTSFIAQIPPIGYRLYYLQLAADGTPIMNEALSASDTHLENEFLRVDVQPNGSLVILDKGSGRRFAGLNVFEDQGDGGDEYDFSAVGELVTTIDSHARSELIETGPVFATICISYDLELPSGLSHGRRTRSDQKVVCPLRSYVTLQAQGRRVDVRTVLKNNARDHRLRVLFPSGLNVDSCYVEGHFDVVERSLDLPRGEGWIQKPAPTHCQKRFIDVSDGQSGFAIANRGLPEYEVVRTEGGAVIALTLVRSVGWLSRKDLDSRPYHVGPQIPTPDAQCQRIMEFEYSIIPHTGDWLRGRVWQQAHVFAAPPFAWKGERTGEKLPSEISFFRVAPEAFVVSALKPAEDGEGIVLRAYNLTEAAVTASIEVWEALDRQRIDLQEQELGEPGEEIPGKGIASWKFFRPKTGGPVKADTD